MSDELRRAFEALMDAMDKELEWVRNLMETQADIMDPDVFMNSLKIDMFSDQVFAFTPQGKVIPLPNGSTAIDFAFAIHTQVGSKMIGAKANGKIVPNSYKLINGDIIEILTSPQAKGPSRDWLNIVKTSQAKSKINQWLKKERRDENIIRGKELLEKEARRVNIPFNKLFRDEWLQGVYRKYNMNEGIEDLYASVGYGGLSSHKIVMRLREEYMKEQKANEPQGLVTHERKRKASSNGIEVLGIDNCLVRLSKCCSPVPGDEIVGFITKGRGVSVHKADCPNIQQDVLPDEDKFRFIKVKWAETSGNSYIATLRVEAHDMPGMMMKISTVLAELELNCVSVNAKATKDRMSVMTLGVEIRTTEELEKAMTRLNGISGVVSVTRTTN